MTWDAVVIGSGFGGAMAAHQLVAAGQRVLMLERGGWVARGPQNWGPNGVGLVTPHFTTESAYDVTADGRRYRAASWHCVGGQSVFYGGASFRFRQRDFDVVTELYYADQAAFAAAMSAFTAPDNAARIASDEENLFDRSKTRFYVVEERASRLT